jgi:hypothetical protein
MQVGDLNGAGRDDIAYLDNRQGSGGPTGVFVLYQDPPAIFAPSSAPTPAPRGKMSYPATKQITCARQARFTLMRAASSRRPAADTFAWTA